MTTTERPEELSGRDRLKHLGIELDTIPEFVGPEDGRPSHYINFQSSNTSVKEGAFFEEQGGLRDDWGRTWIPITASSLHEARDVAIRLRRECFPTAHRTMRQDGTLELPFPGPIRVPY